MKAVIILSGGVDSTTLLYDLLRQTKFKVHAISFNYGQRHAKELACARATCKKLGVSHKTVGLDCLNEVAPSALTRDDIAVPEGNYQDENMKITVVPNRNMVMLSLAISYAIGIGASKVFYGAHGGDHAIYPDCRDEFVQVMNQAARLCDWEKVEVNAPYLTWDKAAIVARGIKMGVDYSLTWTCYKGGALACGKCGSCVERLEAFAANGVVDPIKYEEA